MKVTGQIAQMLIAYLKAYAVEGGYRAEGQNGKILKMAFENEAFKTWVNAYTEFIPEFLFQERTSMNLHLKRSAFSDHYG
jgi:hypothetical protein